MSVNIAAESNVTFVLTHEELLQRKLGQYEILTRVKPKQLIQEFQVSASSLTDPRNRCRIKRDNCFTSLNQIVANIYEPQGIAYVETHSTFLSNELLPLVEKTVTEKKVRFGTLKIGFFFLHHHTQYL